ERTAAHGHRCDVGAGQKAPVGLAETLPNGFRNFRVESPARRIAAHRGRFIVVFVRQDRLAPSRASEQKPPRWDSLGGGPYLILAHDLSIHLGLALAGALDDHRASSSH